MNPDINELTEKEYEEVLQLQTMILLMGACLLLVAVLALGIQFPVPVGGIALIAGTISFLAGKKKLATIMIIATVLLFFFAAII